MSFGHYGRLPTNAENAQLDPVGSTTESRRYLKDLRSIRGFWHRNQTLFLFSLAMLKLAPYDVEDYGDKNDDRLGIVEPRNLHRLLDCLSSRMVFSEARSGAWLVQRVGRNQGQRRKEDERSIR